MKYIKKITCTILTLAMVLGTVSANMTFTAYAGTISSVSLKVRLDIDPGEELPSIDYGSDSGDCYVYTSSNKYSITTAEWITSTSKEMKVGDEPRMKVYLSPEDADDYYFKGSYHSSNVSVNGGTFVSAKRDGDDLVVTIKLKAIGGKYEEPDEAYWKDSLSNLGQARWSAGDNSSHYYDVYLYRGSSVIKKVEDISATSYNFYPYMTKKGDYTFKVRTVPHTSEEKEYGKKSEWTESDEIYVSEEDVSDGTGQTSDNGLPSSDDSGTYNVGWVQNNGNWYYRYPNGSYQTSSWAKIDGKWYLFGENSAMLTGWQTRNNQTYYLQNNGAMMTGWILADNKWYFLNTNTGDLEGALVKNNWVTINGNVYYMTSTGAMAEGWTEVSGNWYYFYPGTGTRAVNTYIDTFYVDANGAWKQ